MPRKLRNEEAGSSVAVADKEQVQEEVDLGLKPYLGVKSLPEPEFYASGSVKRDGEERFFCSPGFNGVDLLAMRKARCAGGVAVKKRMARTLKDQRPGDQVLRKQLRDAGIPGA